MMPSPSPGLPLREVTRPKMPDAGHLFELFQRWTPETVIQQRILVTNPPNPYAF
jgi:hypothetical protein